MKKIIFSAIIAIAAWFNTQDKTEHTDSFLELTDQAEQLSLRLIGTLLSGRALTASQCSASFSGH